MQPEAAAQVFKAIISVTDPFRSLDSSHISPDSRKIWIKKSRKRALSGSELTR